jgi:hypothetical protein
VATITWNEIRASSQDYYVPLGLVRLKRKEFTKLKQENIIVSEYLNKFTQLSKYATQDVNTDEKIASSRTMVLREEIWTPDIIL